jgi:hypothetical protein
MLSSESDAAWRLIVMFPGSIWRIIQYCVFGGHSLIVEYGNILEESPSVMTRFADVNAEIDVGTP